MILGGSGTITSDKITIDANGNAGIGTSSPSVKSHIANGDMILSSSTGSSVFQIRDESDSGRGLMFKSNHSGTSNTYIGTNSSIKNIIFGIDGIERMRLDTSGYLTKSQQPSWHLQPNFTGLSGNLGNPHYIRFGNNASSSFRNFATNVSIDASVGKVTVPVAGKYWVGATWRQEDTTNDIQISIFLNASQVIRSGIWYSTQRYENVHAFGILNLAANDYLQVQLAGANATNSYGGYEDCLTFFTGYLLG